MGLPKVAYRANGDLLRKFRLPLACCHHVTQVWYGDIEGSLQSQRKIP